MIALQTARDGQIVVMVVDGLAIFKYIQSVRVPGCTDVKDDWLNGAKRLRRNGRHGSENQIRLDLIKLSHRIRDFVARAVKEEIPRPRKLTRNLVRTLEHVAPIMRGKVDDDPFSVWVGIDNVL